MASGERVSVPEFGNKQVGIDYIDRPSVYALIENSDNQVAVIETSKGYFLPGGGIDIVESDIDALNREVMEETGFQVSIFTEIGEAVEYIDVGGEGRHYQIRSRFYRVKLRSKVREGIEKDHRLVWLSQEDAVKLLKRQGQVWVIQSMIKE